MVTALAAVIALQGAQFTQFREAPAIPPTTSKEFNIGGGLLMSITYTWSEWEAAGNTGGLEYCTHEGLRKLHISHLACTDGNCHMECRRSHNISGHDFDANIETGGLTESLNRWEFELNQTNSAMRKLFYEDVSLKPLANDMRDMVSQVRKERKYSPFLGEHFAGSCEEAARSLEYVQSNCVATYQIRSALMRSIIHVEDKFTVARMTTVGRGWVRKHLYCKCDPTTAPPKPVTQVSLLPPSSSQESVNPSKTGIWVDEKGSGEYVAIAFTDAEKKYKITFNSERMTQYKVNCAPGPNAPVSVIIVPGFTLDSSDPKVQDMLVCGGVKLSPREGVSAASGRAACLEMRKSEPTLKTNFKPKDSQDAVLVTNAIFHHNSRMSGPWDQARVWMLTDGASYHEIGKVLQPMIKPGRFVKEIMNLQNMAIPASHPRLKSVFDPDFLKLGELTEVERATYAQKAWIADEARCLKWLKDQPTVSEPGFAALASEGLFRNPETTSEILAEKLKKLKKDAFTKQDGWSLLGAALFSSDAKAAGIALRAMESNPDRAQLWYLLNPDPQLPEDIRSRAEKLGKKLEPKSPQ